MMNDLEYAIKQDIRNNPVVREVDRTQKREFLHTLGWAALAVSMLIFALVPRTRTLSSGYRLEQLREKVAAERVNRQRYQIELEMLLRPQELGARAAAELGMVAPSERDTLVLERVTEPSHASRAIVASAR
jgi:hypothetical protein